MENILAILGFGSGILSLLCLLVLHVVSPEFHPSWRMISEYAIGKYKWLITSFFLLWGLSSMLVATMLWPVVTTSWGTIGIVLLLVSAVGEMMGGLFDVKHKLHGLSFLLGVPTLPIGALLVTYNLIQLDNWQDNTSLLLFSAHATWITLILMGVAMMVMMSGFKNAGVPMDKDAPAVEEVPDGVIALGGYANRLLVLCYVGWLLVVAWEKLMS